MGCKVGDRVRFLNDTGGGVVVRMAGRSTVIVLGDDGFEVPVQVSEVVPIDSRGDSQLHSKESDEDVSSNDHLPEGEPEIPFRTARIEQSADYDYHGGTTDPEGDELGLHLAFVPTDQERVVSSDHLLYIVNDSSYRAFYTIGRWDREGVIPIKAGFIEPDTKDQVALMKREDLTSDLTLHIQVIVFKNRFYSPQDPDSIDMPINPSKFFRAGTFTENDFFNRKAMVVTLADTKKEMLLKALTNKSIEESIKQKDTLKTVAKPKVQPEVEEVDLHIHELVDNPNMLSPAEIINLQLARFKIALEGGLKSRTRRMVFIHGVGNGKLKHEVRNELEKNYPKLKYQDASFKEYGYGATMVILR